MCSFTGNFGYNFCNALIFALSLIITGCSFSESSKSSKSLSESTSSIISSPSSNSDKENEYEKDVSDYTMAYVKSSHPAADYNSFLKGLSDVAEKAGISNWDQNSKTYIAIGKGMKKAGIEGIAYETYKKNFSNADKVKMQNIQEGYDSKQ